MYNTRDELRFPQRIRCIVEFYDIILLQSARPSI